MAQNNLGTIPVQIVSPSLTSSEITFIQSLSSASAYDQSNVVLMNRNNGGSPLQVLRVKSDGSGLEWSSDSGGIGGTISTGQVAFGTASDTIGGDNNFYWNNTSKSLGIGTSSPGSKLSISGGVSIGSSYASQAAPTDGLIVQGNVGIGTTGPTSMLDVAGTAQLRGAAGGTGLYVNSNGNVGIGTTNPLYRLNVQGGAFSVGTYGVPITGTGVRITDTTIIIQQNAGDDITLRAGADSYFFGGNIGIGYYSAGGDFNGRLVVNGNVGIGTTDPRNLLHVAGKGRIENLNLYPIAQHPVVYFNAEYSGGDKYITSDSAFQIWHDINSDLLRFRAASAGTAGGSITFNEGIVINTTGNVGIGTTAPTYKLDVNGNARISDTLIVGTLTGLLKASSGAVSAVSAPTGDVVGTSDSQTLTNKRIQKRTSSTTSASSLTPDISSYDLYQFTALAADLTINNPTGSPVLGDVLVILIKDDGTSRTLTFGNGYKPMGQALPTATTAGKTMEIIAEYDGSNWLTSYVNEV